MEYWNAGILGRIRALFFVMFYSEIRNPHSGIEEEVRYGMDHVSPREGTMNCER